LCTLSADVSSYPPQQALGAHERTEDKQFDSRVERFVQLDTDLKKVFEYMQLYFDCVNTVCAAGVVLGESLLSLYNNSTEEKSPLEDMVRVQARARVSMW
jgi:hypothetical protein